MKYIVYGSSRVLTGDSIAGAVIDYAAALAQSALTDVVHVPTSDRYGMSTDTILLLGPAIPLLVEAAPDDELEPDDSAFTEEIRSREHAVRTSHAVGSFTPRSPY